MAKQSVKWAVIMGLPFAWTCVAMAQTGVVVDKGTGAPIAKAYVMHRPSWAIAMTNEKGEFELPPGLVGIRGRSQRINERLPITLGANGLLETGTGLAKPMLFNALGRSQPLIQVR